MQRDVMEYDVVIVGGGPSGLSAAIKFRQLCQAYNKDYSVCVIEKGSEIGAHSLSGAVFEPRSLNELIPDWQALGAPLDVKAVEDSFYFLTKSKQIKLPTPPQMRNHGNYIISLGNLCRWLGEQAEALGVEVYAGFSGAEILYHDNGQIKGIRTGDLGLNEQGEETENTQPGVDLQAKYTLFAEGCRGSLTKQLIKRFSLNEGKSPQTYGIGLKELWEIDPAQHKLGHVIHTIGWPLDYQTYGGSFIYHSENNQLALGFVIGLDYKNPYLNPYQEFQQFKHHPLVAQMLEGGRRIAYGSRALNEGGFQSIPHLLMPGGAIIGCAAGFLNVPKIKGTHTAMKSGMLAAESAFEALLKEHRPPLLSGYSKALTQSWVWKELYEVRNVRPMFRYGLWAGLLNAAFDTYILRGQAPWTFKHHKDHEQLKPADQCKKIEYPKPDGKISFDLMSSVYISNTNHAEGQPCHLRLKDKDIPITLNLRTYGAPETRYCPAGVYEIVKDETTHENKLQINAQNCLHCKTCDIKDPSQNIVWCVPEGGGGPNYPNM